MGASVVDDITARRRPGISLSAWSRRLEPPPFPADLAERVAELDGTFESVAKLSALGVHINLLPVVLICL